MKHSIDKCSINNLFNTKKKNVIVILLLKISFGSLKLIVSYVYVLGIYL